MAALTSSPPAHGALLFLSASANVSSSSSSYKLVLQTPSLFPGQCCKRRVPFQVRAETSQSHPQDKSGRRQVLMAGPSAAYIFLSHPNPASFAAEAKKGFQTVSDQKDGYTFLYPFGWQEVVIEGQDKVFKDVIEPLESVSVNLVTTNKQDVRDLGSPQQVADTLIKKVLAPPSQKTKLIEATEHDVDGKAYYTFEFIAQAPNFTRHALGAISIANGKFYTLTTGSNERRWGKMKDKLQTVIDSFKIKETRRPTQ